MFRICTSPQQVEESNVSSIGVEPPSDSGCLWKNPFQSKSRTLDDHQYAEAQRTISEGLMKVSLKERDETIQDIHGIKIPKEEDPETLVRSCNEIEIHLSKHQNSQPLQLAWNANSGAYVRSLYLMFLRCFDYNPRLAAERIVKHFEWKRKLFSDETLGRDITLDDFNKDDMAFFRTGVSQILPSRDAAGRVIYAGVMSGWKYMEPENVWRYLWYMAMVMCQDEETQKKGCTNVGYNTLKGLMESFDADMYAGVAEVSTALPLRTAAMHACYDDSVFARLIAIIAQVTERNKSMRMKIHRGSYLETEYELMTYGIPTKLLPVDAEGNLRKKEHLKFIKRRQIIERNPLKGKVIVVPSNEDVLFGKGRVLPTHPGNNRMNELIEERLEAFIQADKKVNKTATFFKPVVDEIVAMGGRFLRQDKDGNWEEVDYNTALDKVGHGFRNRKQLYKPLPRKVASKRLPDEHLQATAPSPSLATSDDEKSKSDSQIPVPSNTNVASKRSKLVQEASSPHPQLFLSSTFASVNESLGRPDVAPTGIASDSSQNIIAADHMPKASNSAPGCDVLDDMALEIFGEVPLDTSPLPTHDGRQQQQQEEDLMDDTSITPLPIETNSDLDVDLALTLPKGIFQ